jgi:lipoprotein
MKNIIKTKHHIFVRVTSIVAIVIIAVCSTLAIQGCEKKEKEQTKNIPVNSIAQGYISKYFRNNNFVLKSQQSLDDFIEAFEIPNLSQLKINFDTDMVIAVIESNNSSSTIDITNITEFKDKIEIRVENLRKGMTADIGSIYHIVKIPKTDKTIVFMKITS